MSPAALQSSVNEARVFVASAKTAHTCVKWLAGQFRRLHLRYRATFGDTSTLARLAGSWVMVLLYLFAAGTLTAQTPDPSPTDAPQPDIRPPLSPFPRYQDWNFLRDPAKRVDLYDRLKFIPLNESGTIYLTFGFENRTEFQYLNSNLWGAGPQDHNGYVLERLMPDVDVHLGDHARVFITLAIDEIGGKTPCPGRASTKMLPMDTKVSSNLAAISMTRTPAGMSSLDARKLSSEQDAWSVITREET